MLQVLHRRDVAPHDGAPGLAQGGLLFDPVQIQKLARNLVAVLVAATEVGDEVVLRVAAFVHDDATQLTFLLANIVNLGTYHVAQFFNCLGGKADRHQLVTQHSLRLDIAGCAVAFLVIDLVHFFEQLAQAVKAGEGFAFEFFEFLGQGLGAALAIVIIGGVEFVKVFFGNVVVGFVRI